MHFDTLIWIRWQRKRGGGMTEKSRVVDWSVASGILGVLLMVLGFVVSNIIKKLGTLRVVVHQIDKDIAILQARMEIIHKTE